MNIQISLKFHAVCAASKVLYTKLQQFGTERDIVDMISSCSKWIFNGLLIFLISHNEVLNVYFLQPHIPMLWTTFVKCLLLVTLPLLIIIVI